MNKLSVLIKNLSCVIQSVSALTVEHVQTYRDGVCKTCDSVDSNIRHLSADGQVGGALQEHGHRLQNLGTYQRYQAATGHV